MAKYRSRSASFNLNSTMLLILGIAILGGFIGGYLFAKSRYVDKIAVISQMHMDKAVTIDALEQQIQVLGASTEE